MANPLRAFINFNKKCHSLIAKIFPNTKHSAYRHYREEVRRNLADNISVLEHLNNLESAVKEVSRILKKGGKFISVLPSKFALFAIINQLLQNWFVRKILFAIRPEAKGFGGFVAYCNRCYYPALKNLLAKYGFSNIALMFDYNQSGYFSFFVPFGLIALCWDCLMYILHVKPLCAYICFTAEKS